MYGDFSRPLFHPSDGVTRVLFNQGQPLVEADLNSALLALQEQNQMLVRALTPTPTDTNLETASFAFGDGFNVGVGNDGQLTIVNGFYSVAGKIVEKRTDKRAVSLVQIAGEKWLVELGTESSNEGHPGNGAKRVWLNIRERPLYKQDYNPFRTSVQPAEYIRREWFITLESGGDAVDRSNFLMHVPELNFQVTDSRLLDQMLTLEFDYDKVEPVWKLATSNTCQTCLLPNTGFELSDRSISIRLESIPHFDAGRIGSADTLFVEILPLSVEHDLNLQAEGHLFSARVEGGKLVLTPGKDRPISVNVQTLIAGGLVKFWDRIWSFEEVSGPITFENKPDKNLLSRSDSWQFIGTETGAGIKGIRSVFRVPLGTVQKCEKGFSSPKDERNCYSFGEKCGKSQHCCASNVRHIERSPEQTNQVVTDLDSSYAKAEYFKSVPSLPLADLNTSSHVRRWLASMTMAELSDLSADEICKRVSRDCKLSRDAEASIRAEIERLIVKRDQFCSNRVLHYA